MEIIVTDIRNEVYRPMFSTENVPMTVAYVRFPDYGVTMGFSHRADDPENMWLADCRFDNGMPVYVHGEGARDCSKQIAGEPIIEAIDKALVNLYN